MAHFPHDVPVRTDGVVTLRAHRPSDLDAMVEQCRDPDMLRYTTVPAHYTRADAEDFLRRTAQFWESDEPTALRTWAISTDDLAFCGSVDYRPDGAGTASLGFGLHPAARGAGLMSRAVALVLDHAFAEGVETMYWRAVVGNWASRKTIWHQGFRFDGIARRVIVQRGESTDGWTASLRRDDPRQPCEPWSLTSPS
ncbi:GNAT family N-acetyltransferase [Nocardia sp. AG03]|uniref:GNAT family N-acetyltransferase n=1 Tax=Nocardia sp. AG03 TaxID=3025312 RepID=UPI002418B7DF|nr:GNAT family N-acetyltransferase [Nocardia sp. AG03]